MSYEKKEWYTLKEVAEMFYVPLETVRSWYHREPKKLYGVKRGTRIYISRSEVERIEKFGI